MASHRAIPTFANQRKKDHTSGINVGLILTERGMDLKPVKQEASAKSVERQKGSQVVQLGEERVSLPQVTGNLLTNTQPGFKVSFVQKGRICPKDEKVNRVNDHHELDGVIKNEERTSIQKRVF